MFLKWPTAFIGGKSQHKHRRYKSTDEDEGKSLDPEEVR
jgi:hypothetical protein